MPISRSGSLPQAERTDLNPQGMTRSRIMKSVTHDRNLWTVHEQDLMKQKHHSAFLIYEIVRKTGAGEAPWPI